MFFFTGLGAVQNIKNFQGKVMAPLTLSPEDGRGSCYISGGDCLFDVNLTNFQKPGKGLFMEILCRCRFFLAD